MYECKCVCVCASVIKTNQACFVYIVIYIHVLCVFIAMLDMEKKYQNLKKVRFKIYNI